MKEVFFSFDIEADGPYPGDYSMLSLGCVAFDKEGTARTIVDTLNNSFYRGTGGANNLQLA